MEFIRGASILEYAEAQRLNTHQRLEMIAQVADAVQHAHQRGIIHRDLKPGNILVDEAGQAKILDFGVARITGGDAEATRQTGLGELVGTLAYMSPEQVLGDPAEIDARSDIYSLGVVLYEMLAGCAPYKLARTVYEVARTIREETPTPLGRINREYQGDLETIAARALEKEKARRYSSAAELAADLRHFLKNEPISARPPSAIYHLKKFSARHRGLVASVLAIFVVLVVGLLASVREAIRADRAERAAIAERDRATAAESGATRERDRALRAEQAANSERGRAEQARNLAVKETQRADSEAATAKAVNDFLQKDLLAQASVAGQSISAAKPEPDLKVRTLLDRAAARLDTRHDFPPAVEGAIRDTIGRAYWDLALFPQAETQLERAYELRRRALGTNSPDILTTAAQLAHTYLIEGKYSADEALLTGLLGRLGPEQANAATLPLLAEMASLASSRQGDYAHAEALMTRVLEARRRLLGAEHPDTVDAINDLAVQYQNQGKYAQAETLLKQALVLDRRVLGPEHTNTLRNLNNLGVIYRQEGKYAEAEAQLTAALAARHRLEGDEHLDTIASKNSLGILYSAEGKYDLAEPLLQQAVENSTKVMGAEQATTLSAMNKLADLYVRTGRRAEGESLYLKVLEIRRRVYGPEHPNTARVLASLGELKLDQKEYAEAEPLVRDALRAREKSTPNAWERYYAQSLLGATLSGQEKYAEAEPLLLSGYQGLADRRDSIQYENRSAADRVCQWVVQLYDSWRRPEKAAEWREKIGKR
jgi:tetratricopeptide (TPR) repeat protein